MILSDAFIGLIFSLLCLVPGFGVAQVILMSYSHPGAIPYAICSSLIVNSIKEATCLQISGNITGMSLDASRLKIAPNDRFKNLINNKLICWGLGILVGLIMPDFMLPKEIVIIIILGLLIQVKIKELPSLLLWIGLIGSIYILESETPNIVLLISLLVFNIPQILKLKRETHISQEITIPDVIRPNYALLFIGSLLVLIAPGLSASTVFTKLNTNHSSTELSATLADTLIESAGLVLLLKNTSNGKSLMGDLLAAANIELFISCIGIICISYCLTWILSDFFIDFYEKNENSLVIISAILSCITVIQMSKYGLIIIGISLLINSVIGKLRVTSNLKGFTFCVPIFIN